jgi:hypothetical protein
MNSAKITIFAMSLVMLIFCFTDFYSRVYTPFEFSERSLSSGVVDMGVVERNLSPELQRKLDNYLLPLQASAESSGEGQLDRATLANYNFSLVAIYFKQNNYTAVVSALNILTKKSEMVRFTKGMQFDDVTVVSLDRQSIQLQFQQQIVNLRLFEVSIKQ